jgi:hypothetical protein
MEKPQIDYVKLADEFYSAIAHAAAGSDFEFDDIQMAVIGCIEEVKLAVGDKKLS